MTVTAGDGQSGEPGRPLATRPSVVVKDASGRGVPAISVTFAVDSGGGSVAGGTVATGADGVAAAGNWTLGAVEGRNTLLVTSAGLPNLKLSATGLIPATALVNTSVPVSGGSIVISRAGTPIDGLRIDVPAGSFPNAVQFDVSYASSLTLPHDQRLTVGSPIVTIATDAGGSALKAFTIKIPATIGADEYPIIAMVDPATGFLDALPTITYDATSVTATGTILDETTLPETSLASLIRAGGLPAHATSARVRLAVLLGKLNLLHTIQLDTGFRPGVDDWEFPTDGSPVFQNSAGGQVVAERYYYRARKSQVAGALWQKLQTARGAIGSNTGGYQWTTALSKQFEQLVQPYITGAVTASNANRVAYDRNTIQWVAMSMIASNGAPQIVTFVNPTDRTYSPVLAYKWDGPAGILYDANPDYPGDLTRKSTWSSNGLSCNVFCVPVVGVNHLIGYQAQLNAEWPQVTAGTINKAMFPQIFAPSHSPVIGPGGNTGQDTLFMVDDTTRIWIECPTCVGAFPTTLPLKHGASGIQSQRIYTETSPGQWAKYTAVAQSTNGFFVDLAQFPAPSANHWADFLIGIEARPLLTSNNGAGAQTGWGGWKVYRVMKYSPTLTFAQANSGGPVTVTLSIQGGPPLPVGLTYVFKWHDGSNDLVVNTRPISVQHTFAGAGNYNVDLEIKHPSGNVVVGKTTATFSPIPVWRGTTFGSGISAFGVIPTPGPQFPNEPPIDNRDHVTWWVTDSTIVADIVAHPAHALLVLVPTQITVGGKTVQAGLYLQYDPTGTPGAPGAFNPNATLYPVAQTPGTNPMPVVPPNQVLEHWDNGLTVTPTSVTGGFIAQVKDFTGLPASLVGAQQKRTLVAWDVTATINATANPNTLSGTINRYQSLWVYAPHTAAHGMYWFNIVTYALTFSAVRAN